MGLFGLFGKKVEMQCNCGCGCNEIFEKYGRRAMDEYEYDVTYTYKKPWRGDFEICIDCNLDQHTKSTDTKPRERKDFSSATISETWTRQGGKCNNDECQKKIGTVNGRTISYDYDHMDGDPSNNHPSNCQALCLNCHRQKTNREKK
jgi:5-methylcytosine-specific restriction endonuclease McrA